MDSVEKLSTLIVENRSTDYKYVDSVENLSTTIVENLVIGHEYVDDVEKLSTAIVENFTRCSQTKKAVINVPESKTYPHSLWISR